MTGAIHTLPVGLTEDERRCYEQIQAVMRGNATTDQHDDDAAIVFDVKKYGGYLITEDRRILTRRNELRAISSPTSHWIMTLEEFMTTYDEFVEREQQ